MSTYWKYNSKYDSIEIYFDYIPDEEQRDELKSSGWRWHKGKKCWYNFWNEENEELANVICASIEDVDDSNDCDNILLGEKIEFSHYSSTKNLLECVDCGKVISSHAKYCLSCGAPIDYIKEVHIKRDLERQRRIQVERKIAENKRIEDAKLLREVERKKREEEKKRVEHAKLLEVEDRLRVEKEQQAAEKKRRETIKEFRDEFSVTEDFMTDEEVIRGIDFLRVYAKKIGSAHYMVEDRIVYRIGKYNGKPGFKLYKTEYDVTIAYF